MSSIMRFLGLEYGPPVVPPAAYQVTPEAGAIVSEALRPVTRGPDPEASRMLARLAEAQAAGLQERPTAALELGIRGAERLLPAIGRKEQAKAQARVRQATAASQALGRLRTAGALERERMEAQAAQVAAARDQETLQMLIATIISAGGAGLIKGVQAATAGDGQPAAAALTPAPAPAPPVVRTILGLEPPIPRGI